MLNRHTTEHTCPDTCQSLSPPAHAPCHLIPLTPPSTGLAATPPSGAEALQQPLGEGGLPCCAHPRLQICSLTAAPSTVVHPYMGAQFLRSRHVGRCQGMLRAPPAGAPGEMGRSGCVPLLYLVALPGTGLIPGDLLPSVAISKAQARSSAPSALP